MCWRTNWRILCAAICGRTGCCWRRGFCTGSTPWPGGRSARCRPNARPPATNWRSPHWAGRDRSIRLCRYDRGIGGESRPSAIAPGLIGLFSSTCRLKARVERLLRFPSVTTLRAPIAAGLLLGMALMGLTDAMPGAKAQAPKDAAPPSTAKEEPKANTHTISGRCLDNADRSPLAGISVRLYRVEGRTSPPVEIARTDTDADGRYTFTGLVPPRPENHLDRLNYGVFGFADDRPIGISFFHFRDDKEVVELRMVREKSTLSGKVIDAEGRPVAGATVLPYFVYDRPAPGLLSATTGADGRFKLDNVGVYKWPGWQGRGHQFCRAAPGLPRHVRRGKCATGRCRRHIADWLCCDGNGDRQCRDDIATRRQSHRTARRGSGDHGTAV